MKKEIVVIMLLYFGLAAALSSDSITIISPNQNLYTTTSIPLNITLNENVELLNMILNGTTTKLCENCSSYDNESILAALQEGYHNLIIQASNSISNESAIKEYVFTVDLIPTVALVNPPSSPTNQTNFNLTCSAEDTIGLQSITIHIWDTNSLVYNNTVLLTGTANSTTWAYSLPENTNYTWSCLTHDSSNNTAQTPNQTLIIDTTPPIVTFECDRYSIDKTEVITCPCTASDPVGIRETSKSSTYKPDTSTSGIFDINCIATDNADNKKSVTITYTVRTPTTTQTTTTTTTTTSSQSASSTAAKKTNSTTNSTNTTSTNRTYSNSTQSSIAPEEEALIENTTTPPAGLTAEQENQNAIITGTFTGSAIIKKILPIATFVLITVFIASFVIYIRKKIIKKVKKTKNKAAKPEDKTVKPEPSKDNKYRKLSILD